MTDTRAKGPGKAPARQTFYGLTKKALAKKHRVPIDGKPRWLTLEDIIQRHLVFAQARGSKKALRLSMLIRGRLR